MADKKIARYFLAISVVAGAVLLGMSRSDSHKLDAVCTIQPSSIVIAEGPNQDNEYVRVLIDKKRSALIIESETTCYEEIFQDVDIHGGAIFKLLSASRGRGPR